MAGRQYVDTWMDGWMDGWMDKILKCNVLLCQVKQTKTFLNCRLRYKSLNLTVT